MEQKYFGRFKIIKLLGESSSGTVYLAKDPMLDRLVAIKVLGGFSDDVATERFIREMRVMATLEHRAIVPVYDYGVFEGQAYYVMRIMNSSLRESLETRQNPFSPDEASLFLNRMARALDAIHNKGLVHRNIKPSNILLDEEGTAFLSDFNMVLAIGSKLEPEGSPAYMAPEQITGDILKNSTDIYLLGLVLFEMLTLQRPFQSKDTLHLLNEHLSGRIPSLSSFNPNLSRIYDKVIRRALAKDPLDRYETAGEMAEEFATLVYAAVTAVIHEPVPNPFVVGNPVSGTLFVGRSEIFARIQELWGNDATYNVNSIVLFGHRRMGKTSILQNLHHFIDTHTLVATLTMQRAGRLNNTGELLSYLALAIFDALDDAGFHTLSEPELARYEQNGYSAFNRFLRDARKCLIRPHAILSRQENTDSLDSITDHTISPKSVSNKQIKRLVLTIDEFELIEKAIADGHVDPEFLDFLRGAIHSEPWLIIALAGLHTLEEMTADYWNPLFASVTPIRVSFFNRTATSNLFANLGDDFPLKFTNAVVDKIFELAQGQPYLTQLIAYSLVREYNQTRFVFGEFRSPDFSAEDVVQVTKSTDFYDQGSYYFNGVWVQAEKSAPYGQVNILTLLAKNDKPLTLKDLTIQSNFDVATIHDCLKTLIQHDVVKRLKDGRFDFHVPLMRQWIQDTKLNV